MAILLKSTLVILLVSVVSQSHQSALRGMFPKKYPPMKRNGVDPGEPLFLTPYLESPNTAQKLSLVGPLEGTTLKSHSGFITVNKTTKSNTFFWFFPAQEDPLNAPVVLWLQGGPGGSSLFGLFVENGPIMVDKSIKLMERKITWNRKYSMLYVDNPVGTGFSFTGADAGYARNEVDVANDLYSFLQQFFQIFYQFQKNDFYATGESYAGKYVPAISYKIHTENQADRLKINFKGMAIGDGLCDPESMMNQYAGFMYSIGMLDEKQRDYFAGETQKAVHFIKNKQFGDAFKIFDTLLNGDLTPYKPYFYNVTETTNYYNFLLTQEPPEFNFYGDYLAQPEVRRATHVGNLTYNDGRAVEMHLINDVMDTVKPWIETLLDNYKVMIYNGQLDIIIAVPLTEAFLLSTKWSGQNNYTTVDRMVWKLNPSDVEVAGYVRTVGKFNQVIVRGAGHILPYDQPERGFDMIQRFIENRSFH
ncbi:probable serine carboxypeptidase CPVL [Mizuhopecten yessoensis]|uniref:Serine carboxypeptidase CPVL n=1 Tax=Mizuhopecten yessoensis TaxID=6573 RepID=A0A210QMA7_MIZYE|nr:probable serine carboxypeptidase CPVL [Mizuhopecten yessoensis]OWF49860.1 serine carboxypeptidase CPVL [Mizuhopecten yessoensis]